MTTAVIIYLVIINMVTFCMYGIDKSRAKKQAWRIPNRVLLGLAVIGGSPGALAGMYTFRHKTKTWYYTITVPVIVLIQTALVLLMMRA